ncbi:MAG TPA: ATP-binding cassette domain-containing protein [Rhodopila sp.]|nr:ATP-binding cassette domain-containing protein [Rhodopila sp.]
MNENGVMLRGVSVRYGRRLALHDVSGSFAPGSLTAVVGPNGAGKTTLLGAIAGVLRPTAGQIECLARRAGRLAYLPQVSTIDRFYPITVRELITTGAWRQFGAFRRPAAAVRERVAAAADTVGLGKRLERRLDALSVGELQRALFARVILWDAAVILLDEPFAPVDSRTVPVLLAQLGRWHAEGRTVIAVLHDLELVRAWFPETLVLDRVCRAWGPTDAALGMMAA